MSFSPGMQGWFNTQKSVKVIYHINRIKDKCYTLISRDAEYTFDRIQYPFMIQTHSKVGIKRNFLNLIKGVYEKPTANIKLNGKVLKAPCLRSGTRQGHPLSTLFFIIDVRARELGKRKKPKAFRLERKKVKLYLQMM